ncbi:hypothetical protein F8S09_07950 [Deinococcus sp. SDU3-2]|uniref:Uncharacterized protein n=1 Tax=Deinococcus terrestris TaxID=2651870 RepID=A0A7X1TRP3_9DEIO|nr:hypothetical protein [Deinococcus terrestris]MPY66626.1 hypothetical protein [Deinococcus terrestris]
MKTAPSGREAPGVSSHPEKQQRAGIKPLLLAALLGLASGVISSPNHIAFAGNLCEPSFQIGGQIEGKCLNLVTGWGWPTAFITDSAAVSVVGRVGPDDSFSLGNLLVNILFYYGVLSLTLGRGKQIGSR